MTRKRVLLVGATGVFGRRLAAHLARMPGLDLVLTSRDDAEAQALARGITPASGTVVSGLAFDHRHDLDRLAALSPWLVIDASGPFQGASHDLARAALMAGAHVVDLADARDYILGYGAALDDVAKARGLVALTGASSTPALSAAAVAALTAGWRRIDTIDIAITPGGRSEVGRSGDRGDPELCRPAGAGLARGRVAGG
jgi:saccharopine dehydrogenase-like NADP-dependent oxidoreductase